MLATVTVTACASHPSQPSAPLLSLSSQSHDFGATPVGGRSEPLRFSVFNHGEAPSGFLAVRIAGPDAAEFAVVRDQCSGQALQEATACVMEVGLRPTSPGPKEATLAVFDPRSEGVSAALRGSGTDVGLGIAPAAHTFDQTMVGTQSPVQTLVVHNTALLPTGSILVEVSGGQPAEFPITRDTCSGQSLALGGSCAIDVRFAPGAIGLRQARVTVSASPGGSVGTELSGTGGA